MKTIITMAVMLTATVAFCATSYDGFDYTAASEINGADGGANWAAAWTSDTPTGVTTIGDGLSYTDGSSVLASQDGSLTVTYMGGGANVNAARTISAKTSGSVFVSAIFKQIGDNSYDYFFQFSDAGTWDGLLVRGSWGGAQDWRWGGTILTGATSPATDETQFIVAEINLDAGTVGVWVNPNLTTPGAAPYSATTSLGSIDAARFFIKNENAAEAYAWDEIRIGDTFADVAPTVPEPTLAVLALVGAFMLRFFKK